MTSSDLLCHVCGHDRFAHTAVLWPALIAEWELSEDETRYFDVQQGTHCVVCGANVRSIALALAITRAHNFAGPLVEFIKDPQQAHLRILEINEAGSLHPTLMRLPRLELHSFPACDMCRLDFADRSFDLVVHSDTLEHVIDPLKGLQECRRVLTDHGSLAFTVPIRIGRLSRNRTGMPSSYHGYEGCREPGMLVYTEFGADLWTLVLRAGFTRVEFVPYRFPSGLAIVARV